MYSWKAVLYWRLAGKFSKDLLASITRNMWNEYSQLDIVVKPCEVFTWSLSLSRVKEADRIGCSLTTQLMARLSNSLSSGPLISNALTMLLTRALSPDGWIATAYFSWSISSWSCKMVAGKLSPALITGAKLTSASDVKLDCEASRNPGPLEGGGSLEPLVSSMKSCKKTITFPHIHYP